MSVFKKYQGKRVDSRHPHYKDGKWWMYKRMRGSKPIHKSLPDCLTKDDAEKAERREIEKSFNRRYNVADTTTTFADFCDRTYTKYVAQNNINIKVKELYVRELNKLLGAKPLTDITPQDCRDCQYHFQKRTTKTGETWKTSYVNRFMSTLSKILTLACEETILDRSPMQFVKSLKEPAPRRQLLTVEQKEAFWREVEKDPFLWRIVTLAVNLPLRRGQILAIKKEDVDLQRGVLKIIGSKGRAARTVPLNQKATAVLTELCENTASGFLFVYGENSNVMKHYRGKQVKDFGKRWRNCLIRAGINEENGKRAENFHFHDLRTYFASELISRNVSPLVVQKLFAHSSMQISGIYMEADEAMLSDAVKILDESFVQEIKTVG